MNTIRVQRSKRYRGMIRASGCITVRGVRYRVKMCNLSLILYPCPDLGTVSNHCTINRADGSGGDCPDGARMIVCGAVLNAIEHEMNNPSP
jgi:hypothetical protein